jgi:7,8-dihydro-6-hydroxymethylpterin-pyrophosphokinase
MFVGDVGHPIQLAAFLKRRQREYYNALLEVQTKLRWSPWLELFLGCTVAPPVSQK